MYLLCKRETIKNNISGNVCPEMYLIIYLLKIKKFCLRILNFKTNLVIKQKNTINVNVETVKNKQKCVCVCVCACRLHEFTSIYKPMLT